MLRVDLAELLQQAAVIESVMAFGGGLPGKGQTGLDIHLGDDPPIEVTEGPAGVERTVRDILEGLGGGNDRARFGKFDDQPPPDNSVMPFAHNGAYFPASAVLG